MNKNECTRCIAATQAEPLLHTYEWFLESYQATLFWNVAEVRLAMRGRDIQLHTEYFPYADGFTDLVCAHEIHDEHVYHIPTENMRPSLVGNMTIPNIETGEPELFSVMLDGHHSALSCLSRNAPVQLHIVPEDLMIAMAHFSRESLMTRGVMVLEGNGMDTITLIAEAILAKAKKAGTQQ